MTRCIIVRPRDLRALRTDAGLTLKGGIRGLRNGDRVTLLLRDMCEHEGVPARVRDVSYEVHKGDVTAYNVLELDA